MKLIPLDALLAEIERLENQNYKNSNDFNLGAATYLGILKQFLDTLEVKEVDLDFQRFAKEMDAIFALPSSETKNTEEEPLNWEYAVAKHFFELGLNASNPLTWEDIKLIWTIGDEIPYMPEEDFFKELLKRFNKNK